MAHTALPNARMLTFTVGGEAMGMAAAPVREVVPVPRLTRVPHAPAALLGVAHIRGEIVPVLCAARLLGRPEGAVQRVVVMDVDGPVGLAVGDISGIVASDEAAPFARIEVADLVARAFPQRRGGGRSRAVVATAEARSDQAETIALVGFAVGGQDFALPLSLVAEVLRLPDDIARLPQSDAATLGSVVVRGAVLPLLSLAALLTLPPSPITRHARIVVVQIGAHRVGLVVEAMRNIERVPEPAIETVPHVLNRGAEARIQALCRLSDGRLLSVLAPDQLLSEAITARLMAGNAEERTAMTGTDEARAEGLLLFRIAEAHFALPIDAVEEVALLPPKLTSLPKAPAFVRGLMNLRGQVIPVIDQGQRFDGTPVAGARPRVIVLRIGTLTAGFIVDAVSEVVRLPASALRPAPDLGGAETRVFDRIATLDGREQLVLVVSPQELLDRAERDLLASLGTRAKTP